METCCVIDHDARSTTVKILEVEDPVVFFFVSSEMDFLVSPKPRSSELEQVPASTDGGDQRQGERGRRSGTPRSGSGRTPVLCDQAEIAMGLGL